MALWTTFSGLLVTLALGAGCGANRAEQRSMERIGGRMRSAIEGRIGSTNPGWLHNAVLASRVFAVEMILVGERNPSGRLAEFGAEAVAPIDSAPPVVQNYDEFLQNFRQFVAKNALQPKLRIRGMDATTYDAILHQLLAQGDMAEVDAIRTRLTYWKALQTELDRNR